MIPRSVDFHKEGQELRRAIQEETAWIWRIVRRDMMAGSGREDDLWNLCEAFIQYHRIESPEDLNHLIDDEPAIYSFLERMCRIVGCYTNGRTPPHDDFKAAFKESRGQVDPEIKLGYDDPDK